MSCGINDCADGYCDRDTEFAIKFFKYSKEGVENYFCSVHAMKRLVLWLESDETIQVRRLTELEKEKEKINAMV